jgi:hypothetical protein
MAISRPFLLALLGAALLAATVFAVQNARNTGGDAAPAAQAPAEQATPAAPASTPAGPEQLLESAFRTDFESAAFDARLSFSFEGQTNLIRVSGAVEDHGEKQMPEVDLDLHVRVASMNLNERGGFTTTGPRAWFTRGNVAYAVPQSAWGKIVQARRSGAEPIENSTDLDLDPGKWLNNIKDEGKEQVGGVQATHISAELDSAEAVTDIVEALSENGSSPVPLPNAEQRLRQGGLTEGKLDVWVGEDKVLRRLTLSLSGPGSNNRRVDANFSLALSGVNEPQQVVAPANVRTGELPGGMYGQVANGVLTSAAKSAGVEPSELRLGVPVTNSHVKAERAVADKRKVVILFQNPRALDDKAVAAAVREVDRRMPKVVVLSDDVQNVDRYGSLLEDLGVNQAPAIVVIGRNGEARLIEGYTDAQSLAQVVAEAR